MPPSSTFLRIMYRARREVIPPNPPSQSEIDVSGDIMYLNDCSIVHGVTGPDFVLEKVESHTGEDGDEEEHEDVDVVRH